jgi:hypothetical protein
MPAAVAGDVGPQDQWGAVVPEVVVQEVAVELLIPEVAVVAE